MDATMHEKECKNNDNHFCLMMNSVRRFFLRESSESFGISGMLSPLPVMMSLDCLIPFAINAPATD